MNSILIIMEEKNGECSSNNTNTNSNTRATDWIHSLKNQYPENEKNVGFGLNLMKKCNHPNVFEGFVIRGIRFLQISSGQIIAAFNIPPRLVDKNGRWRAFAVMALIDNLCGATVMSCGLPLKVSVDFNVSYITLPKLHEEIEIDVRVIGHNEDLTMVAVDLRSKSTGKLVVQARQSMYGTSKMFSKI